MMTDEDFEEMEQRERQKHDDKVKELEAEENQALKKILADILNSTDVCSLCQRKGKPPHTCSLSTDCISELLKLYK